MGIEERGGVRLESFVFSFHRTAGEGVTFLPSISTQGSDKAPTTGEGSTSKGVKFSRPFFFSKLFPKWFATDILIYHPSFSSPLDHPPSPLMSSIVKYVRGVDLNGADFKVTSLEFFFARHLSAPNATHRTYIYICYKNASFFLLCIFFDDVVRATKTIRVRASCMSLLPRTFAFRATMCGPAVRRCAALLLYS